MASLRDGKFGRVSADGDGGEPAGELLFGLIDPGLQLADDRGLAICLGDLARALDSATQPLLVKSRYRVETFVERSEYVGVAASSFLVGTTRATSAILLDCLVAFVHRIRIETRPAHQRAVSGTSSLFDKRRTRCWLLVGVRRAVSASGVWR